MNENLTKIEMPFYVKMLQKLKCESNAIYFSRH